VHFISYCGDRWHFDVQSTNSRPLTEDSVYQKSLRSVHFWLIYNKETLLHLTPRLKCWQSMLQRSSIKNIKGSKITIFAAVGGLHWNIAITFKGGHSVGGVLISFIGRWARRWVNHYCLWRTASATPDLRLPSSLSWYSLHLPMEGWPGWVAGYIQR